MKKNILIISLTILTGLFLAGSILAATNLSFSPASVNVAAGETFNMTISINPQGIKNYTVKTEIEFPADLLEIKSFSFGNNWMPLSQSGYDLIDNTGGLLIKTAGYPGGLSLTTTFGTISFLAKKDGTGTILASSNSFSLDATNKDLLGNIPKVSVVVTTPIPIESAPTSKPTPKPIIPISEPKSTVTITSTPEKLTAPVSEVVAEEKQAVEEQSFLASIGGLISFRTGSIPVGIIVSIIALLIIFFIIKGIRLRKSK